MNILAVLLLLCSGIELVLCGLCFGYNHIRPAKWLLCFTALTLSLLAIR